MPVAFLFPGQNSQQVGMGRALANAYPDVAGPYFEDANRILGWDIAGLCFDGSEDELVKTENQQPAIFLVSVATLAVLAHNGLKPDAVAGHSLGEYAALVAAGSLSFEDGLRLTRRRGELMAGVAAHTGGIMAAVLGLPADKVEDICREASDLGIVEVANYNSPSQTVISGEEAAVQTAMEAARAAGAKRVIQLNVSAPFHCSLMAPLAEAFAPLLDETDIQSPEIPVVANVTARTERTAGEVRANLVEQLASPVRWTDSIRTLQSLGIDTFVEVGPGKVLTGLLRSIAPEATARNTATPEAIEALVGVSA